MSNSRVGRNATWLLVAEFISRAISFSVIVWLVNYLGSSAYGNFAYALAIANVCVIIADFGLSTYITREIAKQPSHIVQYLIKLQTPKVILSIVALGVMLLIAMLLPNTNLLVVMLGGSAILFQSGRVFVEAFFRAQQKMHLETITKVGSSVLLAMASIFGIVSSVSLEQLAFFYMLGTAAGLLLSVSVLWFTLPFSSRSTDNLSTIPTTTTMLLAASPFAVSVAFNYLFNYLDSIMLGAFNLVEATGWYNAAYKPIFFITAIAGMIISGFFPAIARAWKQNNPAVVHQQVEQLFRINMLVVIPIAVGGTIMAPQIIELLFAAEFAPATLAFQLLLWSTVSIYFWATFGNSLQACNYEKVYLRGFAMAAILNVGLNVALIIPFSLYGAAIATLLTQLFLALFMSHYYSKLISVPYFILYLWRPLAAAATMGITVYIAQLPLLGAIILGAISYGIFARMFEAIADPEIKFIRSITQP